MMSRSAVSVSLFLFSLGICSSQILDTFMNRTIAVCPDSSCQSDCFGTRDEGQSCYCDEQCEVYSDCCYDFWDLCKNETFLESNHNDVQGNRFVCRSIAGDRCDVSIKMINNCPKDYSNGAVKQSCKSTSLEYLFPVIAENGYVYANKYCAQCSGENASSLQQFPATMKCPDDSVTVRLLENITSSDTERWRELQLICLHNITVPVQFISKVRFCSGSRNYADSCERFDKRLFTSVAEFKTIQSVCRSYQGFVQSSYSPRRKQYMHYRFSYKNSHCAMCNGIYPRLHNVTCPAHGRRRKRQICYPGPGEINGPSFTVLLDFGRDFTIHNVHSVFRCPEGHEMDIESKTCLISCPFGYRLSTGRCLVDRAGDDSSFLSFSTNQDGDSNVKTLDLDSILDLLESNGLHNLTVNDVSLDGRDFVEVLQSRYSESKHQGEPRKLLLFCIDVISETMGMNNFETSLVLEFNFTGEAEVKCKDWELFDGEVSLNYPNNDVTLSGIEELVNRNNFLQFEMNVSIWKSNETHAGGDWSVRFCGSRTLTCPLVLVVDSYIELLNETHLYLSTGETINSVHFTKLDGKVFVCDEFLANPITFSKPFFTIGWGNNRVHYYMTLVGLSLSVSGLILTLGVYLTLEPLRTVPGKIMMNLNVSLMFAQLIFLIGADKTQSHVLCLIIGTLEHYLWLVAFLWMNVISVDLAKTFATSCLQCHDDTGRSLLLRYSLYSWGLPAVHVTICFLLDYFDLVADETLTYISNQACFLSGYYGMLYAFVLPLTVIMVINLFCFAGVLIVLAKASALEKKIQKNRIKTNQLFLSVKLIPITGLTWIFGVVATLGRVPILWHPFIVFNSLQGVFVFFAFVLNRRVTKMLRMKLIQMSSEASGSSNTRI